ncbi:SGNH/GDSL hydrolase family protein [Solidesulfovibrio sp.]|uniref:SGNH/GDSL hydrolase family protein n=1 Tax=Solidesulfovibrio sp. TaxID=2910990 RepID=UPI002B1EA90B|nr:SGNH/GDSL hydrolase family protein [Solidesulfovibrio sp.]MEA5088076.1 SGNH/GDSL hydrolase family protein [Solidesulfovibrio sp.]
MKRFFKATLQIVKWAVIGVLCLEALSFAVITTTNWIIYGNLREGPKAVYDPYALFLMENGVWPTAYSKYVDNHPELSKVIWFFGGSTMRASAAPYAMSIPSLVAKKLNETEKPYAFNCFNFGVNSFNSLLESKYLEKQLIEFPIRPDLVVFYDGANDANYFAVQKTPYAHEGRERVQGVIESYYKSGYGILKPLNAAYFASFTRELLQKLLYTARPVDPNSPELAAFVDLTVKRYDFIDRLCAAEGAQFLLALQPLYWVETCAGIDAAVAAQEKDTVLGRKTFPHVRENFVTVYAALERGLAGKPYFVNLREALCGRNAPAYTADGVHNTDAGREGIAAAMLPAIRSRLSLPKTANDGGPQ